MIIYYKALDLGILTRDPIILISDIDSRHKESLTVKLSGIECSFAVLNGKRYKLSDGTVKIPLKEITDGVSDVVFVSGTKRLHASPFTKTPSAIERAPFDSEAIKSLEELMVSLLGRLEVSEKRISALEERILPKSILNFK